MDNYAKRRQIANLGGEKRLYYSFILTLRLYMAGHRKPKRSEGESKRQAAKTVKNFRVSLTRRLRTHPKDKVALKRFNEL